MPPTVRIRLDRWVGGFLKSFEAVYRLQKEGKAFSTLADLVFRLKLGL